MRYLSFFFQAEDGIRYDLVTGVQRCAFPISVYVGGGTQNLLHAEDYIRLMNITRRIFGEPSEGVERTLEGIPQLFNHDKVQAIKEAGFNRVSIDRKSVV